MGKDIQPGACTNWDVLLGSANKTLKKSAVMNLSIDYQGLWGTTAADVNGDVINDIAGISNIFQLYIWRGNPRWHLPKHAFGVSHWASLAESMG